MADLFPKAIISMANEEEELYNAKIKKEQQVDDLDMDISEITGSPQNRKAAARFNDPQKAPPLNPSVAEKANELYKEIKEVLPGIDFEAFAKNINLLNNVRIIMLTTSVKFVLENSLCRSSITKHRQHH
jgi:hypothetical protein